MKVTAVTKNKIEFWDEAITMVFGEPTVTSRQREQAEQFFHAVRRSLDLFKARRDTLTSFSGTLSFFFEPPLSDNEINLLMPLIQRSM